MVHYAVSSALMMLIASVATLSGCGGSEDGPTVLRLVELFPSASVTGAVVTGATSERTAWRFGEGDPHEWKAGVGVSGLRVDGDVLTGRSTTGVPIVHVERQSGLDDPDVLHQVIIRTRVSEGLDSAELERLRSLGYVQ